LVLNRTDEIEILLVEDNPSGVFLIREAFKLGEVLGEIKADSDLRHCLSTVCLPA